MLSRYYNEMGRTLRATRSSVVCFLGTLMNPKEKLAVHSSTVRIPTRREVKCLQTPKRSSADWTYTLTMMAHENFLVMQWSRIRREENIPGTEQTTPEEIRDNIRRSKVRRIPGCDKTSNRFLKLYTKKRNLHTTFPKVLLFIIRSINGFEHISVWYQLTENKIEKKW